MPGQEGPVPQLAGSGEQLLAEAEQCVSAARAGYLGGGHGVISPQVFLSQLSPPALRSMLEVFEPMLAPAGSSVIEEGTTGSEAFILARGELQVTRSAHGSEESIELAHLGAGALFGEMALLSRAPRAASVVAVRPSILLVARKDGLDSVARAQPEVGQVFARFCRRRMVENLVRTSPMLRAVAPSERPHLVEQFVMRTFEQGDRLISQGQNSEGLYLIASGEVSIVHREADDSTFIARLGPGEVVGEVALVLRRPANADVLAVHPTIAMHLPRDHFLELIRAHPAVLAELYELAIQRDEETTSIVAQEAADIDDAVLI
jgi:cAMP-dependent protein kinase regulator